MSDYVTNLAFSTILTDYGKLADFAARTGSAMVGFAGYGANSVNSTANTEMATWVSPQQKGATGDGVTDDTAAFDNLAIDLAALPATRPIVVRLYGTYLVSKSVKFARANIHVISHGATIKAKAGGIFNSMLTGIAGSQVASGDYVLFDMLGTTQATFSGRMTIDPSNIANLNGIGTSDNDAAGGSQCRFDVVEVRNSNRGVCTLDNGNGGLIGTSFGTLILGNTNRMPLWLVGNAAADTFFTVCRINGGVGAGLPNVHIEEYGVSFGALYCAGGTADGTNRVGIEVAANCSIKADHIYLEKDYSTPITVAAGAQITCPDIRTNPALTITGSAVISAVDRASVDVKFNHLTIGLPYSLIGVNCTAGGTMRPVVKMQLPYIESAASAPFFNFTGTGLLGGVCEANTADGITRYNYDGTTKRMQRDGSRGMLPITFNGNSTKSISQDENAVVGWFPQVLLNNTGAGATVNISAPDASLLGKMTVIVIKAGSGSCNMQSDANLKLVRGTAEPMAAGNVLTVQCVTDGSTYWWQALGIPTNFTYGAADSGGAGFKTVAVPNTYT